MNESEMWAMKTVVDAKDNEITALTDALEDALEKMRAYGFSEDDLRPIRKVIEPAMNSERPVTVDELLGALQTIMDWADLAINNPKEFDNHGVKLLEGPAFDAARAVLSRRSPSGDGHRNPS